MVGTFLVDAHQQDALQSLSVLLLCSPKDKNIRNAVH